MRIRSYLTVLFFFLCVGFLQSVSAGERLDYDVRQTNGQERITIFVQGSKARILSSADQNSALIFDASQRQIHILDHVDKSVTTINQSSLEQLASIAQGVGELAKSQGGVLGDIFQTFGLDNELGESAVIEAKVLEDKKSYSGQSCQMLQVYRDGQLNTELCLSNKLRLAANEQSTLDALLEFAQMMLRQGQVVLQQFSLPIPLLPEENLMGTPVFVDDRSSKTTAQLTGFKTMDVLARQFSLPEGYTRRVLSL